MMKSAIDWLMGKTESLSNNNDLNSVTPVNLGAEQEPSQSKDLSNETSIFNGHHSGVSQNRNISFPSPIENSQRSNDEEIRSPWGRTLTPKSPKYISQISPKASSSRINSHSNSKRMTPPVSWEDMSFASDVMSPGFATRIAKEARTGRKMYDGSRRYPIGQEKYIRTGVLPNVRLKGRPKPVVMTRRAPTSPIIPLASPSPFSSSSLASGFLASATTRMPDISSVASVLDSTTSSAFETIKDPTSVQAVVAALEQAQNIKSGVKRSRYGESEETNKKQKCNLNSSSLNNMADFSTPIMTQAFSSGGGGGGGGEKRALDLSPPSSGESSPSDRPQLSPENKRRCIPDPRIASFSSSKNIANHSINLQSSGRETPFSIYESHPDSDSESNKSIESHHSRQSERSFRGQNQEASCGRTSTQEQFDRSGSQTPQSLRGSYGLGGVSNGSKSSSRTNTPSRPSHVFSLEAYKADKAKSHQRLNKMLGMLFNVSDEEIQIASPTPASTSSVSASTNNVSVTSSSSSSEAVTLTTTSLASTAPTGLLKEAFSKPPADASNGDAAKSKEGEDAASADVSTSFTFTLKSPKSGVSAPKEPPVTKPESTSNESNDQSGSVPPKLPSYQDSVLSSLTSSSTESTTVVSKSAVDPSPTVAISNLISTAFASPSTVSVEARPRKQEEEEKKSEVKVPSSSLSFPSFTLPSATSTSPPFNPLGALKDSTLPTSNTFSFGAAPTTSTTTSATTTPIAPFSFGKQDTNTVPASSNLLNTSNFTPTKTSDANVKLSDLLTFGANSSSSVVSNAASPAVTSVPPSVADSPLGLLLRSSTAALSDSKDLPKVSPSGLFNFGTALSSPNFKLKDNKAATETSQSLLTSSPFVFGASLPSSTSGTTKPTSTSTTPASSMFSFGSSQLQAAASNSPVDMNSPAVFPDSQPKSTNPSESGFSFAPSQLDASRPPATTNASFGSANLFAFGASSLKTSVPSTSSPLSNPLKAVSSTPSSTGLFTFGDSSSKPAAAAAAAPTNAPSFQFGSSAAAPASTVSTPAFGGGMGGGFSFGGMKQSAAPSTVHQFGATTSGSSASSFSFKAAAAPPPSTTSAAAAPSKSGFDFAAPKTSSSAAPNLFAFGGSSSSSSTAASKPSPSPFGLSQAPSSSSTPAAGGGFGATPKPSTFTFGNSDKTPAPPAFGSPAPPAFGASSDTGSKSSKALFGASSGHPNASPAFGAAPAASPFGMTAPSNPFNNSKSAAPAFGAAFGASKSGNDNPGMGGPSASPAPNVNPFQMGGQVASPNAAFTFGQSAAAPAANSQPGVFMFGSSGAAPPAAGPPAPAFGGGGFNFGGNNMAANNMASNNMAGNNMAGAGGGTNLFTLGASSSESATAPRRVKVRAHRRR